MVVEKIKFKSNKLSIKEARELKEHSELIESKIKAINERYRTSWDTSKKTWKKGMRNV
tara:strand:- start:3491 stop:3664 length:174 start_codon:yes stop_codon:yes gene_type:complete